MVRRPLGSSGFEISPIGLGSWAIGGWMWGGQDDAESIAAIHAGVDCGVNWIDTAPIYGSGHSERVVGDAVRRLPASRRPLIFTKFGLGDDSDRGVKSAAADEIIAECEASLKRLQIDCIDLYQLHWPAPQPVAETAAACQSLLQAGKIRAIGVSNFSVAELEEWQATGVPVHALQAPYSILRPAVETSQLPWCARSGVGVLAYSPLFRGLLFGTWTPGKTFPSDDGRSTHKDYSGARLLRHLEAIEEIKTLAAESAMSCAQMCVGTLFTTPGLTGCIVGARNAEQGALAASLAVDMTDAQAQAVRRIIASLQSDLAAMS